MWESTITEIGPDAADMFDAGVIILFAEPVPPALSEVSIVHNSKPEPGFSVKPQDVFQIGNHQLNVAAVGELASNNLVELGHIVIYVNPQEENLLPGAVHATGTFGTIDAGETIKIFRESNA